MFEEIKKAIESMQKQCEKDIDYTNDKDMTAICLLGEQAEKVIKALSEYMELKKAKAEGRLVELPCNVGGTVYEPFAGKVYEKTVDRIIINRFTTPQIWIETKLPFATPRLERWDMAFGKTVFLTREEAEKAIGGGKDV